MIKGRLDTLETKKEVYSTTFLLQPIVTQPPILADKLIDSFSQYTYADQIIPGEAVYYKLLPQSTNRIVMLEGTSFLLNANVVDPSNARSINNLANVTFYWTKDDSPLYEINAKNNLQGTGSLLFKNARRDVSGTYRLSLSNKYGNVVSDELIIDIIDINNHPLMYKNLIQNPNGSKGTEGWTSENDFIVNKFIASRGYDVNYSSIDRHCYTRPRKSDQDTELEYGYDFNFYLTANEANLADNFEKIKQISPNNPQDGYSTWLLRSFPALLVASEDPWDKGCFFPSPRYIDIANKNDNQYSLSKMLDVDKSYFTRDKIKFTNFGGKANTTAYQDIDISSIRNIVDGEAYGIDNLVAHFFAYIGIGITRYQVTYTTSNNEEIVDNTIPMTYESYIQSVYADELKGEVVKPPVVPYLQNPPATVYSEQDMVDIINTYCPKDPTGQYPTVVFWPFSGEWSSLEIIPSNNPWPNLKATGILDFASAIRASGWWIGFVENAQGTGYERIQNTDTYRVWFTKINNPNSIKTPDGRAVKLIRIPNEVEEYKAPEYAVENGKIKRQVELKVNSTNPFKLEPVVDDITEIRLDFIDQDGFNIQSQIIDGPTAKDIWAVKEKFYMPFYIANTYNWVVNLTNQPIQIYNKVYTTLESVKNAGKASGIVDLHAGWLKRYYYALFRQSDIDWFARTRIFGLDAGAAAMFGISSNVIIPKKTRTIRVNVIFKHTSNVIYDVNPLIKQWKKQEIYYDYLTSRDVDVRAVEYGNPRCGITCMHLSLHPNNVNVDEKHPTYKIPKGNVWYKHKELVDKGDANVFNSIGIGGGLQGNENLITNLIYPYNIKADEPLTSFETRTQQLTEIEIQQQVSVQQNESRTLEDVINGGQQINQGGPPSLAPITPNTTVITSTDLRDI